MPFMAITLSTRSSDSEEETYIESPTLTQPDESGDNLKNEDSVPEAACDASNSSENIEKDTVGVRAEHMPLGGIAIEEEMLKAYRTVLDGDRAMSEVWYTSFPIYMHSLRKDAFKQLLKESDGKAYNQRELAATFLLTTNVLESNILDEKDEIFALLRLLQHQDENVRTLAFNQLSFLIPRCPPSAIDYTVSVVAQNLRKSLAACTWSSPSEAEAIQNSALYLAGHYPAAFFNEIFPDATGTHHAPLKWLSENYSTLKTTTFVEHPEAGEELIRVMEKCGSGVAEGIGKCIRALECSVGILEIWKGLVRVPGEVGIALLGTWLGGLPREFLRYGGKGSSGTVAVVSRKQSSSPSVEEGIPPAAEMKAPPSTPSSTSSESERLQESHVKSILTRSTEIPQRQPPVPVNTKRKSFTSETDPSWRQGRRQSTYTGPATAPLSTAFSRGCKRRKYDSFRPGSPRNSSSRRSTSDNLKNKGRGYSHTPVMHKAGIANVCNPALVSGNHQSNTNQHPLKNSQQYQFNSRSCSSSIPPGPMPPPLKPAFSYSYNMPIPTTHSLTATWQRPFQGQSLRFPRGGYGTYPGEGGISGRNERASRGQNMWNIGRYGGRPRYMGYQHGGRWFSSYRSSDRYRGEASGGHLGIAGEDANVPPKSTGILKISTPWGMNGGTTVGIGSESMASNNCTHSSPPALSHQPLQVSSV
ncbi:hypothetical protein EV426DRAFT_640789 [Tirmania nivea]|nr:hypothetical protein EV426DRAFT_640789 [Tirmania nivea]